MDIAWLRDLVIVIYGLASIIVLIVLTFLVFALYRRVKAILDSVKITAENVESISTMARKEIAVPLMIVSSSVACLSSGPF